MLASDSSLSAATRVGGDGQEPFKHPDAHAAERLLTLSSAVLQLAIDALGAGDEASLASDFRVDVGIALRTVGGVRDRLARCNAAEQAAFAAELVDLGACAPCRAAGAECLGHLLPTEAA